jgi:hypothetical protein
MLAEIHSPKEMAEVFSYLDFSFGPKYQIFKSLWIGLTDRIVEGEFLWANTNQKLGLANWETGEPNGKAKENCVYVGIQSYYDKSVNDFGLWGDANCNTNVFFALCQKGKK